MAEGQYRSSRIGQVLTPGAWVKEGVDPQPDAIDRLAREAAELRAPLPRIQPGPAAFCGAWPSP